MKRRDVEITVFRQRGQRPRPSQWLTVERVNINDSGHWYYLVNMINDPEGHFKPLYFTFTRFDVM